MSHRNRYGPIRSLLVLAPVLLGATVYQLIQQRTLPPPLTALVDSMGLPQISEAKILSYARDLSEGIGYRTVGTSQHAESDVWMLEKANALASECADRGLECEVWRQQGDGSHRFDMMGKRLYKTYVGLTNTVVRISDPTLGPAGKEHAVLVNAHVDSTLPSPGAADDGLAVGVMLECMRVLTQTPGWKPKYAIVLLFNNGEESLQDASHLFSTQHDIASTVRAVINLEAAGTTGREILFQATSEEMIHAYSHVPRPFGTVFANDIFSSGVMMSDTDFRQFELYLNVTGLDIAVVGNSYMYHMRGDIVENIEVGVAQNMGENVLALLRHLSADGSPIPSLVNGYKKPTTVFFEYFGVFLFYSFQTANLMYGVLTALTVALISRTFKRAPGINTRTVWSAQGKGVTAILSAVLGALVATNVVAFFMWKVLGKGSSWFTWEYAPLFLYGPPALFGALYSQYLLGPIPERDMFTALLLMQAGSASLVQLLGVGSAAIFFICAAPLFVALVLNEFIADELDVSLWSYSLGQINPLLAGIQVVTTVSEVFVPLTGRTGADVPADHVVAVLTVFMGTLSLPLVLPFAHRFGPAFIKRVLLFLAALTVVGVAVFSVRHPFDRSHQRRMFVLHLENITTSERHMHLSTADGTPGFTSLVAEIAQEFGVPGSHPEPIIMDDYNGDWDPLYPFSAFLTPFKFALPGAENYISPWVSGDNFSVSAIVDKIDEEAGTRELTLKIHHPGLIWTVIAFDAHVLKWSLDDNPPDENVRHHVKEISFYGIEDWTMDMTIKLPPPEARGLAINFNGIQEQGMWPGKKSEKEFGGPAMKLFETLDQFIEDTTGGTAEALLIGCVAGITTI